MVEALIGVKKTIQKTFLELTSKVKSICNQRRDEVQTLRRERLSSHFRGGCENDTDGVFEIDADALKGPDSSEASVCGSDC